MSPRIEKTMKPPTIVAVVSAVLLGILGVQQLLFGDSLLHIPAGLLLVILAAFSVRVKAIFWNPDGGFGVKLR